MNDPLEPKHADAIRSGRLHRNIAALVSARGVTVVLALLQVLVAVPYLGEVQYGAWMMLLAIAGAVQVCDFGIGLGTQRAMAEALSRQDPGRARAILRSGAVLLAGNSLAVLVLGLPLLLGADWPAWCGLTVIGTETRHAALLLLGLTAVALPLNMAPRLAGAAQLQWIQALWGAAGSAATLGWILLAARAHRPFSTLVAGAAAIAIGQNIAMASHTLHRLAWFGPRQWRPLPRAEFRQLLQACSGYALPQFGLALVQAMPPTALALAGGPGAVTTFNLVQRLLAPFLQAQALILSSLWPAYTDAQVRGETGWVLGKFRQTLVLTGGLLLFMLLTTLMARPLISVWTRHTLTSLDPPLVWLTCAWFAALALVQPLNALLIGLGHWRELARSAASGYPAAAAGLLAGAVWYGPRGALGCGLLALGLILLPALCFQCRRTLARMSAGVP